MRREALSDTDLHAFVDGELDETWANAVRAHLGTHPADAGRVEGWRRQNIAIRRAYDTIAPTLPPLRQRPAGVTDVTMPMASPRAPAGIDAVRAARRRRRLAATASAFLAGACATALGAIAIGRWGTHPDHPAVAMGAASVQAHAQNGRLAWRTYSHDAEAEDRPVSSGALRRATALPAVPDLTAQGLTLSSGRLMPGVAEPAAFLLYETAAHKHLALIVERTAEGDAPAASANDAGLHSLVWRTGGFAITLVTRIESDGTRNAPALPVLAQAVTTALMER